MTVRDGSSTMALWDPGEENWPVKLHLGAGGIYLKGYTNIDIVGELAADHPLQRQANETEIWDYYARLQGTATDLPVRRETIVDLRGDLIEKAYAWDIHWRTVDKVVCLQMFEHLSPLRGRLLLDLLANLLRRGAPLILSVPDMEGTIDLLEGAADERAFAVRHLRGSRRDEHSFHKSWYTRDTLLEVMHGCGFRSTILPNIHVYPALCVRGISGGISTGPWQ